MQDNHEQLVQAMTDIYIKSSNLATMHTAALEQATKVVEASIAALELLSVV